MDPIIISDTIQEFGGERYYKCGPYFQRDGKALHAAVWETHEGSVPDGFEVHHKDHDPANNRRANLELLEGSEHARHHAVQRGFGEAGKQHLEKARELAKEWHRSEEGREWHKDHYRKMSDALHSREERTCEECGTLFLGLVGKPERNRFCSAKCKAKARRRSGVDNELRTCCVCGTGFMINKYWTTMTCSRSCGRKLQEKNRERQ
uniref:HNH nuclease domain-containing protein n=1 Tax=Pseudomonas phage vB_PaeS_FBPa53 TaxID=3231242 RepID=A0AAU8KTB9_9VIRU